MMSSKQKGVLQCLYGCEVFFPMRIHLCLLAYIAVVPPSHGQDGKGRCGKCFYKATVETLISPFNLFSAHGTLNSALFLKVLLRWTLSLDLSAPHEVSLWPRDVLSGWLWCVVKTQLAEHFQDKQRRQFTIWFYESHLHFAEFFKQQALKKHILSMVPRRIAHTFPVSSQRMVSHTCYEELEIYS